MSKIVLVYFTDAAGEHCLASVIRTNGRNSGDVSLLVAVRGADCRRVLELRRVIILDAKRDAWLSRYSRNR